MPLFGLQSSRKQSKFDVTLRMESFQALERHADKYHALSLAG